MLHVNLFLGKEEKFFMKKGKIIFSVLFTISILLLILSFVFPLPSQAKDKPKVNIWEGPGDYCYYCSSCRNMVETWGSVPFKNENEFNLYVFGDGGPDGMGYCLSQQNELTAKDDERCDNCGHHPLFMYMKLYKHYDQ